MRASLPAAVELIRYALGPAGQVEAPNLSDTSTTARVRLRAPATARPRDAELRAWTGSPDYDTAKQASNTIWVISRASEQLLRRLRDAGQSFVDVKRGVVRLSQPGLLIDRTDLRPPRFTPAERALRDPFGDRASLIVRAIVESPARTWTTRSLAAEVGVSTMTASHVVRQLGELGVLEVEREGRANTIRLRNIRRLVERWTMRYDWQRNESLTVEAPIGSAERFLRKLPGALKGMQWALTLHAGASLIAPHAAWDKIHVFVDVPDVRALAGVARRAGWSIGDGKLVLMRPWYAQSVWFGVRERSGLPVVSNLQLILDLWHYPVRGYEQAEHLLEHLERRIKSEQVGADA